MTAASKKQSAGAPAWVMTFADLMALLMCFFVLLLAFSELDVHKYKQLAGSMRMAFGVQRDVEVKAIPKGTSVIAQEFSPGKPTHTVLKELKQQTTDETKDNLDFTDSFYKGKGGKDAPEEPVPDADTQNLLETLRPEIESGLLDVELLPGRLVIRIREKGSFSSGSAKLIAPFLPVLDKIADVLAATPGKIAVAGHTDNVPISTRRYRSNWELSAARAVSVVHHLLRRSRLEPVRFLVEGHADSDPLTDNDSVEGRKKNRRVEISILGTNAAS